MDGSANDTAEINATLIGKLFFKEQLDVPCRHLLEKMVSHSGQGITSTQGHVEVWLCSGQTFNSMLPYQILALRNVRNTGTEKLPVQTVATCKKDYVKKHRLK